MNKLYLNFYEEIVEINLPKNIFSLMYEISQRFLLSLDDASELILSYEYKSNKNIIKTGNDYEDFIKSNINKIDIYINQDSQIFKKNLLEMQSKKNDKKILENLLFQIDELKNEKESKFFEFDKKIDEYNKKIKEVENQRKELIIKIREYKHQIYKIRNQKYIENKIIKKKERNLQKKIKEIKKQLGIPLQKNEKEDDKEYKMIYKINSLYKNEININEEKEDNKNKIGKNYLEQIKQICEFIKKNADELNNIISEKSERSMINDLFMNTNKLTLDSFISQTNDLYDFNLILKKVLFNKIDIEEKGFITKEQLMKYHILNFEGCSENKKYFNFIKSPNRDYIVKDDFKPILQTLMKENSSLIFLKEYPTYQQKYIETVIARIFYMNDSNDDGKITFNDFEKNDLFEIIQKIYNSDVNKIRQYFSYEHFYVIYTTFYENSTYEVKDELYIPKEVFCTYAYNLGMRTVNRIFDEIPRKFVSEEKYMMSYEDFIYYMISEEDKTSPTSIKYWFKVIDLNNEGFITKKEMEYFYEEQIEKLKNNKKEVMKFKDVFNKIKSLVPPKMENKWYLQNFLDNPKNSSIVFNMLLNMNKINNKEKDSLIIKDIENGKDYSDWDIFAYKEFKRKIDEDNDENENDEHNEEEEEEEEKEENQDN